MTNSKEKQTNLDKQDHISLALWAADCAEHVLSYFEQKYPDDDRPRKAIASGRAWARDEIKCGDARAAAFAAHAAARNVDIPAARFGARAAGHAAATAHVATHAASAANYAVKAASASGADGEREWQYRRLPKQLRVVAFPTRSSKR